MTHRAPDQTPDVLAWLTPARRKALYLVLTAVAPILVGYGVVEQSDVALWLALAASILGTGTAALHTPKPAPPSPLAGLTYGDRE